jgi:hypothetical protein
LLGNPWNLFAPGLERLSCQVPIESLICGERKSWQTGA